MTSVLNIYWKDWCWNWNSKTFSNSCEESTHWQSSWWKIEGRRRKGSLRMRWFHGITNFMNMGLSKLWEWQMDRKAYYTVVQGLKESDTTEWMNWTELMFQIVNLTSSSFLCITNTQNPPKPMSIVSLMPSNHLILCRPLLLLPSIPSSIRVFSNESALPIRWPNYCSFSFNTSPSSEHPWLISFRMDSLDFLASQGTLMGLFQHHSSKASIIWHSSSLYSNSHIHTWPLEKP